MAVLLIMASQPDPTPTKVVACISQSEGNGASFMEARLSRRDAQRLGPRKMQERIDRLNARKPGLQAIDAVLHLPEALQVSAYEGRPCTRRRYGNLNPFRLAEAIN
jgi:hypothetical protein